MIDSDNDSFTANELRAADLLVFTTSELIFGMADLSRDDLEWLADPENFASERGAALLNKTSFHSTGELRYQIEKFLYLSLSIHEHFDEQDRLDDISRLFEAALQAYLADTKSQRLVSL